MSPVPNTWLQLYYHVADDMRFHQAQITRLEQRLYDLQRAILNHDMASIRDSDFTTRTSRIRRRPSTAPRQESTRFSTYAAPSSTSTSNSHNLYETSMPSHQTHRSLAEDEEETKEEYTYYRNANDANANDTSTSSSLRDSAFTYLGTFDFPINQLNNRSQSRSQPLATSFARSILNRSSLSSDGTGIRESSSYDPSTLLLYFMMENLSNSLDSTEPHGITDVSRYVTDMLFHEVEDPQNTCCPIKMEIFTDEAEVSQINKCKHLFCRREIRTWLERHHTCPLCRTAIDA